MSGRANNPLGSAMAATRTGCDRPVGRKSANNAAGRRETWGMTDTQRRWRLPYLVRLPLVLAAVVAALVIGWKVTHPQGAAQPRASAPAVSASPVAAAPATPAGSISDGVWIVGSDVQPGTYRSSGAETGGYCMWSRHSSTAGGPFDAIIASDGSKAGQVLVTIQPGDKLFRTHGCAPFTKV